MSGGSGQSFALGVGPYPIDWSTGKAMSFTVTTSAFPSTSRCPDSEKEFDLVGTIVRTSGTWTKRYLGHTVAFDDCLTSFVTIQLVPGTEFTIDP